LEEAFNEVERVESLSKS